MQGELKMMHFLTLPFQLRSDAFEPFDPSKCWSWLRNCRRCCRQSAAIQRSFDGDGATSLFECCSNPGRRELMSAHSMGLCDKVSGLL